MFNCDQYPEMCCRGFDFWWGLSPVAAVLVAISVAIWVGRMPAKRWLGLALGTAAAGPVLALAWIVVVLFYNAARPFYC